MVKANNDKQTINNTDPNGSPPIVGKTVLNAVSVNAPVATSDICQTPVTMSVNPVNVQIIKLSINVPVMEINPCSAAHSVFAAAAAIGALPSPDSFEKTPRAIPFRMAIATVAPVNPPTAAVGVNALLKISSKAGRSEA